MCLVFVSKIFWVFLIAGSTLALPKQTQDEQQSKKGGLLCSEAKTVPGLETSLFFKAFDIVELPEKDLLKKEVSTIEQEKKLDHIPTKERLQEERNFIMSEQQRRNRIGLLTSQLDNLLADEKVHKEKLDEELNLNTFYKDLQLLEHKKTEKEIESEPSEQILAKVPRLSRLYEGPTDILLQKEGKPKNESVSDQAAEAQFPEAKNNENRLYEESADQQLPIVKIKSDESLLEQVAESKLPVESEDVVPKLSQVYEETKFIDDTIAENILTLEEKAESQLPEQGNGNIAQLSRLHVERANLYLQQDTRLKNEFASEEVVESNLTVEKQDEVPELSRLQEEPSDLQLPKETNPLLEQIKEQLEQKEGKDSTLSRLLEQPTDTTLPKKKIKTDKSSLREVTESKLPEQISVSVTESKLPEQISDSVPILSRLYEGKIDLQLPRNNKLTSEKATESHLPDPKHDIIPQLSRFYEEEPVDPQISSEHRERDKPLLEQAVESELAKESQDKIKVSRLYETPPDLSIPGTEPEPKVKNDSVVELVPETQFLDQKQNQIPLYKEPAEFPLQGNIRLKNESISEQVFLVGSKQSAAKKDEVPLLRRLSDKPAVSPISEDTNGKNKSYLMQVPELPEFLGEGQALIPPHLNRLYETPDSKQVSTSREQQMLEKVLTERGKLKQLHETRKHLQLSDDQNLREMPKPTTVNENPDEEKTRITSEPQLNEDSLGKLYAESEEVRLPMVQILNGVSVGNKQLGTTDRSKVKESLQTKYPTTEENTPTNLLIFDSSVFDIPEPPLGLPQLYELPVEASTFLSEPTVIISIPAKSGTANESISNTVNIFTENKIEYDNNRKPEYNLTAGFINTQKPAVIPADNKPATFDLGLPTISDALDIPVPHVGLPQLYSLPEFSEDSETPEQSVNIPVTVPKEAEESKQSDETLDPPTKLAKQLVKGMPFDYNWGVRDLENGNMFSHNAVSDGLVTKGNYKVLLPDGRYQIVEYRDEGQGFNVVITYEDTPPIL